MKHGQAMSKVMIYKAAQVAVGEYDRQEESTMFAAIDNNEWQPNLKLLKVRFNKTLQLVCN